MDNNYFEYEIKVNDKLKVRYIENDDVANIFINNSVKNLLTQSAHDVTFEGLFNLIAFYTKTENYRINNDGVVLYGDVMDIEDNLYMQLEDSLSYYDEDLDDISPDYDENYEVTLNYRVSSDEKDDVLIGAYSLYESVYELFQEIADFVMNKEYYMQKILPKPNYTGERAYTDHVIR